jgi:hypothetical protein
MRFVDFCMISILAGQATCLLFTGYVIYIHHQLVTDNRELRRELTMRRHLE